jgi:geranylgeranyl diphosphate synthase type I
MTNPRAKRPARPPASEATDEARARAAFRARLEATKPAVEAAMVERFDAGFAARAELGKEARTILLAAKDLSLRGGKRFRAALLASSYFGVAPRGKPRVATSGGVALEMLQSYLLIQDDWMDGDVERRGGPSAHVSIARTLAKSKLHAPPMTGAIGALLASDYVWGLAVGALIGGVPEAVQGRAIAYLLAIHEDVVFGQILDTLSPNADVEVLHDLKTGAYTVRGPLGLGAILGGADMKVVRALYGYADPLGVAFQLRDDLLGVFGTEEEAGRPQGSDLLAGKSSAVVREARPKLRGAAKKAVDAVWKQRDVGRAAMSVAVRAIEDTGARATVERRLATLCSEAEGKARKLPLAERARLELLGASLAIRVGPGGREAR